MSTGGHSEGLEWAQAVDLLCRWDAGGRHLDDLLEKAHLGRSRWLVMEVFRHWLVLEPLLAGRLRRRPRPRVMQILRLGLTECLLRPPAERPPVVHHAVNMARAIGLSEAEAGMVNAVLRGLAGQPHLERFLPEATHPEWLVRRWQTQFGAEAARQLIEWNQAIPELTVQADACPDYAEVTAWPGFFRVKPCRFAEAIAQAGEGSVYIQDPFTRIPVDLLQPFPGETILDLCAAPGGKTRLIAARMAGRGCLVAVDKPGHRLERLRQNAARLPSGLMRVVGSRIEDLGRLDRAENPAAGGADAVLIDVPCSNTGVIRKRPDVKLRLQPQDIGRLASQQLGLLRLASCWVRPGGRLVYSTCSLEHEENEGVVQAFIAQTSGFELARSVVSLPWVCGHDGGGAFLLTRLAGG